MAHPDAKDPTTWDNIKGWIWVIVMGVLLVVGVAVWSVLDPTMQNPPPGVP